MVRRIDGKGVNGRGGEAAVKEGEREGEEGRERERVRVRGRVKERS